MAKLDDLECRRLVAARNYDALIRLVEPHATRVVRFRYRQADPDDLGSAIRFGIWDAAKRFTSEFEKSFLNFSIYAIRSAAAKQGLDRPPSQVLLPRDCTYAMVCKAQAGERKPEWVGPGPWEWALTWQRGETAVIGPETEGEYAHPALAIPQTDALARARELQAALSRAIDRTVSDPKTRETLRRFVGAGWVDTDAPLASPRNWSSRRPRSTGVLADRGWSFVDLARSLGCNRQWASILWRDVIAALPPDFRRPALK